jgi:lysophospholipase L1-like esterase
MNPKTKLRDFSMMKKHLLGGLSFLALIFLSACENPVEEAAAPAIDSIAVLGDSVASGEGINYGYTYYHNNFSNYISHWRGGTDEPVWDGDNPLCHNSNSAYGNLLADELGVKFAKFACIGATYHNGLADVRTIPAQDEPIEQALDEIVEPAQDEIAEQAEGETIVQVEVAPVEVQLPVFGDWGSQDDPNTKYDAATPDVVVLTFGANDVNFVDVMKFCMTGYGAKEANMTADMAQAEDVSAQIHENYIDRHAQQKFLEGDRNIRRTKHSSSYCTAENPGAPIEKLFWQPINSGVIATNYQDMVKAIQQRGESAGKVPQIIFTTYHNPLPSEQEPDDCFDLGDLDRDEINYINTLQDTLNSTIKTAVGSIPGVAIADISGVMNEHKWCSEEPWTYGMTVLIKNPDSQAPFHPTAAGQKAIAEIVKAAIQ